MTRHGRFSQLRTESRHLVAVAIMAVGFAMPAAACPDPANYQNIRQVSAEELYRPRRFGVQAGGPINLGNCRSVPGVGWVASGPDLRLILSSNPRGRRLEIRVVSACDAVLLVNSPSGIWFFDDDSNGNLDPKFSINNARRGAWDIWIGRLGRSESCDAELVVETF